MTKTKEFAKELAYIIRRHEDVRIDAGKALRLITELAERYSLVQSTKVECTGCSTYTYQTTSYKNDDGVLYTCEGCSAYAEHTR